ncbi:hypothetical protein C1H46_033774 [Malus baccata]|uniref:Uncharacterized protein n=1 Tax=Malus baccata TaxID=106549 RepID=A0A540L2K1_MALBA|nr:hypothetical protein C1H46_033774 [Malus baccata]
MASDYVDSVEDAIDLEYESVGSKSETESEGDQEEDFRLSLEQNMVKWRNFGVIPVGGRL